MVGSFAEENGVKKLRVKPYPDPEAAATEWMTEDEIHDEAMKESKRWVIVCCRFFYAYRHFS